MEWFVAEGVKDTAFNAFLLFYYNAVLGLPGSLGGIAIFLALCVDAICGSSGAIDDDSACTDAVVADTCGLYDSVTCSGAQTQVAPTCPAGCGSPGTRCCPPQSRWRPRCWPWPPVPRRDPGGAGSSPSAPSTSW